MSHHSPQNQTYHRYWWCCSGLTILGPLSDGNMTKCKYYITIHSKIGAITAITAATATASATVTATVIFALFWKGEQIKLTGTIGAQYPWYTWWEPMMCIRSTTCPYTLILHLTTLCLDLAVPSFHHSGINIYWTINWSIWRLPLPGVAHPGWDHTWQNHAWSWPYLPSTVVESIPVVR